MKASSIRQSVNEAPRCAGLCLDMEEADATPLPTNPLVNWIIKSAWTSASISDLVAAFATELVRMDIPLLRLSLHIRTLHPLLWRNSP